MQTSLHLGLLRLRHRLQRLGWPAMLGLALLAAALAVDVLGVNTLEDNLETLLKRRGELRSQMAKAASKEAGPTLQLESLQERARIDSLLAELHETARQHQVVLEQGEYRIQPESGTRLARYRMVLPARGNYVQLRAWLDALAAAQPGLQIDELGFKRENIGQDRLEARVSLSLLVRAS